MTPGDPPCQRGCLRMTASRRWAGSPDGQGLDSVTPRSARKDRCMHIKCYSVHTEDGVSMNIDYPPSKVCTICRVSRIQSAMNQALRSTE